MKRLWKIVIIVLVFFIAVFFTYQYIQKTIHHGFRSKLQLVLIQYNQSPISELTQKGIFDGLKNAGLKEGTDFEFKIYNALGKTDTLNTIIDAVIPEKPDLIFATSSPTIQLLSRKIKDIPIVFTAVSNPLITGTGSTFENHIPNITGISTIGDYRGMIRWMKKIAPATKKIGTLFTPSEVNSVKDLDDLRRVASWANIEVISAPVNESSEIAVATRDILSQKPDIFCQIVDNLTSSSFSGIMDACREQKVPVFGFVSDQAEKGAVFVISRDYYQAGMDAVFFAMKIWNGKQQVKDIPFDFVTRTNTYINIKAAAEYGIKFPKEILSDPDVIVIK